MTMFQFRFSKKRFLTDYNTFCLYRRYVDKQTNRNVYEKEWKSKEKQSVSSGAYFEFVFHQKFVLFITISKFPFNFTNKSTRIKLCRSRSRPLSFFFSLSEQNDLQFKNTKNSTKQNNSDKTMLSFKSL